MREGCAGEAERERTGALLCGGALHAAAAMGHAVRAHHTTRHTPRGASPIPAAPRKPVCTTAPDGGTQLRSPPPFHIGLLTPPGRVFSWCSSGWLGFGLRSCCGFVPCATADTPGRFFLLSAACGSWPAHSGSLVVTSGRQSGRADEPARGLFCSGDSRAGIPVFSCLNERGKSKHAPLKTAGVFSSKTLMCFKGAQSPIAARAAPQKPGGLRSKTPVFALKVPKKYSR